MKTKLGLWVGLVLVVFLVGCNGYEDGPAISFRSKFSRMQFTRPITLYTVDGLDSLAGLTKLFRDSLIGFEGQFKFKYEPGQIEHYITWGDGSIQQVGIWSASDKLDYISLNIPFSPFEICCWDIQRLSNTELWLRNGTHELRFER